MSEDSRLVTFRIKLFESVRNGFFKAKFHVDVWSSVCHFVYVYLVHSEKRCSIIVSIIFCFWQLTPAKDERALFYLEISQLKRVSISLLTCPWIAFNCVGVTHVFWCVSQTDSACCIRADEGNGSKYHGGVPRKNHLRQCFRSYTWLSGCVVQQFFSGARDKYER